MQVFKSLAVCFNEHIVIGTTKEDSRPSNKGGFFSTFFLIVFDLFFVLLFFLSSEHGEVKVKKDLDWEIAPKSVSFFFLSLYLSLIPCLRQEKHSATQKSHREERGREKRQVRKRKNEAKCEKKSGQIHWLYSTNWMLRSLQLHRSFFFSLALLPFSLPLPYHTSHINDTTPHQPGQPFMRCTSRSLLLLPLL